MEKYYAAVGQWRGGYSGKLGVSIYRYDLCSGELEPVTVIQEDIAAGQICVDEKRGVIYAVDEKGNLPGDLGGGSYVYAFRVDRHTGEAVMISKKRSLSPFPCSLCLDPMGKYLLVSCNSDKQHVTKIKQCPDGSFTSETVYDDAALLLFPLDEDGGLEDVCDLSITPNGCALDHDLPPSQGGAGVLRYAGIISHLHSVAGNADGTVFAVCDLGMGKVFSYGIDRENNRLIQRAACSEALGYNVRYGIFHPKEPWFYANCESVSLVLGYKYGPDGILEKFCEVSTLEPDTDITTGSNDIVIHPNGKHLYCSNISDRISVMKLTADGTPELLQTVPCGGSRPRALCISPDGRFLFSGNNRSSSITRFAVAADGTLTSLGSAAEDVLPSAIKIFALRI